MNVRLSAVIVTATTLLSDAASAQSPDAGAGCPPGAVLVSGGSFSPKGAKGSIKVASLCVDKTEVTVASYEACVKAGACTQPKSSGSCTWKDPAAFAKHPINCVKAAQASAFCAHSGARLPTEHEWEWAARGGASANLYPWGAAAPDVERANACGAECADFKAKNDLGSDKLHDGDDKFVATAPVGSFPKGATAGGLLDLAGNVAEWTEPAGTGKSAAARGGHFNVYEAKWLTTSNGALWGDGHFDATIGFRCVRAQ